MAKQPKPNRLLEGVEEVVRKATEDALEFRRATITYHLRNGLENGVPLDSLSAVFNMPVEDIQDFELTGQLKD